MPYEQPLQGIDIGFTVDTTEINLYALLKREGFLKEVKEWLIGPEEMKLHTWFYGNLNQESKDVALKIVQNINRAHSFSIFDETYREYRRCFLREANNKAEDLLGSIVIPNRVFLDKVFPTMISTESLGFMYKVSFRDIINQKEEVYSLSCSKNLVKLHGVKQGIKIQL